jgi:hypothetical protein
MLPLPTILMSLLKMNGGFLAGGGKFEFVAS